MRTGLVQMVHDWLQDQLTARNWRRVSLATREALVALKPELDPHNNVARWLGDHPDHRAIRGWLVHMDAFRGHSIVDTGVEWLDVTPGVGRYHLRFLAWHGTDAEYWRLPQEVERGD